LFGQLNYYTAIVQSQAGQQGNNEYRGCVYGCNRCNQQLQNGENNNTCYGFCKNANFAKPDPSLTLNGDKTAIVKGIVEPDKSCLFGCTVNLCQGFCAGGTRVGTGNTKGTEVDDCLMVTTTLVQSYTKIQPNSLAVSQACCTNLQNVCFYNGAWVYPQLQPPKGNWPNVLAQTRLACNGAQIGTLKLTTTSSYNDIYSFYELTMQTEPATCGSPYPET